jgi:phage FluMu gp28-like protein
MNSLLLTLALLMPVSINPSQIESDSAASRYFLTHQLEWIEDEARMKIWEKSFRIGATYADAFLNVRKRLVHGKRDYLFATRDHPSALEYMDICKSFCEVFNLTKNIVSSGVDDVQVPIHDATGRPTGFTEEIKIGKIVFDNGSRILAFSSNPNAMLVYGGDVGLDEFPRHGRAEELYQIAQARVTWGYDLSMWGSHFGNDTLFYRIALDARAGKGGWSHHFTTIEDAVGYGLVEKINETRGTTFTREGFLADCKNRARDEATYQESYMCNPKGGTAAIVNWSQIELCSVDYEAERVHLEERQIVELFGQFRPESKSAREGKIHEFLRAAFPKLLAATARHTLGYDVAASGKGDLACVYMDEATATASTLRGLLTFRTQDWDFHDVVTRFFMTKVVAVRGAGDGTGLGMKICWELVQLFPGRFESVNFASFKAELGSSLMNRLATAEKRWPKKWADVGADYYAIRKTFVGNKWVFTAGTNNLNAASHCDIAWAGALSDRAGQNSGYVGAVEDIQSWGKPRGEASKRTLEG